MKRVIRIEDLCFESKYFHSANLRVMQPPGLNTYQLCLVITLFITGGMKDYGVMNLDPTKTVDQYSELLRQIGCKGLTVQERTIILTEKHEELNMRTLQSVVNTKLNRMDRLSTGNPVDKMPPVGPAIPEGTPINQQTGLPEPEPAKP